MSFMDAFSKKDEVAENEVAVKTEKFEDSSREELNRLLKDN